MGLRLRPLTRLQHLDQSGNGAQKFLTHAKLRSVLNRHPRCCEGDGENWTKGLVPGPWCGHSNMETKD
ncbi:hypothetical protein ACOMHN_024801 [Nucella lapillus]